jgi:hypothetical protein
MEWFMNATTPAALHPGIVPVPTVQEAVCPPGPVWTGEENFASSAIRFPDDPTCSKTLYRLSYPGPQTEIKLDKLF